ncbi:MAG: hypothetical protein JXX14_14955 [Deltaproteobacteria bacterium]|nr:hypothetical protein [Deltaproteobacteria bacterium]
MDLIFFENGWLVFILVTVVNALVLNFRSRRFVENKPELKEGYQKFIVGMLFYGNIPWIIVGIGNLTGMTSSLFEYFSPGQMNPVVLVFHASLLVLWGLSVYWIYFRGGAEFIESHPGLFTKSGFLGATELTATDIKRWFPVMLLGGVVAVVMMWTNGDVIPAID